jgi:pimeloyl-ACP methyl ester carboxylesterase
MTTQSLELKKSTNVQTVSKKKSTNARVLSWRDRALRRGLGLLDAISPALAARAGERLFLSPRSPQRPAWEVQLLTTAKRGSVRYVKQQLPTYTWGEGAERVLLLHGWEGRGSQLGGFVPGLIAAGYQVVALDLPGHGDAAPALSSVVDFGRAVSSVVQQLGPFRALIGHSAGAAAAALAYTFQPFAARLVLIGAPRSPRSFLNGFAQYFGLSRAAREALDARIAQRFGMSVDEVDVGRLGAHIPLPTLVIHDRNDNIVPFAHGLALVGALPQARLMETQQLGHRRILRDASVIEAAIAFVQDKGASLAEPAAKLSPEAA